LPYEKEMAASKQQNKKRKAGLKSTEEWIKQVMKENPDMTRGCFGSAWTG